MEKDGVNKRKTQNKELCKEKVAKNKENRREIM